MLISFFYALRDAKLPVSVKEFLTLLEALQANVVGPTNPDACSMDDFYYLARTALVKDEKHFDKFDRAFAAYFKGVEIIWDPTYEALDTLEAPAAAAQWVKRMYFINTDQLLYEDDGNTRRFEQGESSTQAVAMSAPAQGSGEVRVRIERRGVVRERAQRVGHAQHQRVGAVDAGER